MMLSMTKVASMLGLKNLTTARQYLHARGAVVTATNTGAGRRYYITTAELRRVCPQLDSNLTAAIRSEFDELRREIEAIRDILHRADLS